MKSPLTFHFVTLFPETISPWLKSSILGRALKENLFCFKTYQLRDFTDNKHKTVDDLPYGGGGGMILKIDPLVRAVEHIQDSIDSDNSTVVYFSPAGTPLNQASLEELDEVFKPHHFILICGHYEGIDQRFLDHFVDLEISLGDFVVTGGELPALAFTDALVRRQKGALGDPNGSHKESFSLRDDESNSPLLEYPHYTRPERFRDWKVPDVLLSGNHKHIQEWRKDQSKWRTEDRRPDLLLPSQIPSE